MKRETFLIQLYKLKIKDVECIGHSYHINDDKLSNE